MHKQATELHGLVSNIDMENDDKYYKVHEMVGRMRKEFERLKSFMEKIVEGSNENSEWVFIKVNIENEDPESLVRDIDLMVRQGKDNIMLRHENGLGIKHGDWVEIQTVKHPKKDTWDIRVVEMFCHEVNDGESQMVFPYTNYIYGIDVNGVTIYDLLNIYRKQLKNEFAKQGKIFDHLNDPYQSYNHEGGEDQTLTEVKNLTADGMKDTLKKIFEEIKKHPRKQLWQRKRKK